MLYLYLFLEGNGRDKIVIIGFFLKYVKVFVFVKMYMDC